MVIYYTPLKIISSQQLELHHIIKNNSFSNNPGTDCFEQLGLNSVKFNVTACTEKPNKLGTLICEFMVNR